VDSSGGGGGGAGGAGGDDRFPDQPAVLSWSAHAGNPEPPPLSGPGGPSLGATDAVFQETALAALERASPVALLTPPTGFVRSHRPQPADLPDLLD
jgi:hypothetical protein